MEQEQMRIIRRLKYLGFIFLPIFTLMLHIESVCLSFINVLNFNFYFLFKDLLDVIIKVDLKSILGINLVGVL